MIVDLAEKTRAKITRRNELEQIKENKQNIDATAISLKGVSDSLVHTITSLILIKPLLTEEQMWEIVSQIRTIDRRIKASREKFADQPRQVQQLASLKKIIEDLNTFLKQAWASYAYTRIRPKFELFNLVEQMPEVAGQMTAISPIKRNLEAAPSKLPQNVSEIERFERDIKALDDSLGNLKDLPTEVTQFLYKVQNNTATIADLSDDVLTWCRKEDERAAVFKITIG